MECEIYALGINYIPKQGKWLTQEAKKRLALAKPAPPEAEIKENG